MFLLSGGLEIKFFSLPSLFILHNFFAVPVTAQLNRMPREVMEFPSLEIFMNHLDAVLCNVLWEDPAWTGRLDQRSFLSLPILWITLAMPDSCSFPYNHCPVKKERGKRNRVLSNSSAQHNLLHTLTTVHSLHMVGFGMELGFFGWFEFFEGGVYMCLCLYIEC